MTIAIEFQGRWLRCAEINVVLKRVITKGVADPTLFSYK